jgi:ubiquinone/menaquinone biosynthesis C-methylase UbiE
MAQTPSQVKQYWEDRAQAAALDPSATTDDYYLRELEIRTFVEIITRTGLLTPRVLDLGCGDGFTTLGVARQLSAAHFVGADYSENMVHNAEGRLAMEEPEVRDRVRFRTGDATKLPEQFAGERFDIVISSRCLINLTSSDQQYRTIADVASLLNPGGVYVAIENFMDGQRVLSELRADMGLPEIPVRWHNLFFEPEEYLARVQALFSGVDIVNFSSAYYYATRVVYSKYCQLTGVKPDYHHEIHRLAIDLPPHGNYSPIKLVVHRV